MEDIKQQIGRLIKETRKKRGLTQEELGRKLGVGKTVINKYESGNHNVTVETVEKLMNAMGARIIIQVEL